MLPSFPSSGDCLDLTKIYFSSSAINILTDIAILFLPLKPILNLNINRRRKGKSTEFSNEIDELC